MIRANNIPPSSAASAAGAASRPPGVPPSGPAAGRPPGGGTGGKEPLNVTPEEQSRIAAALQQPEFRKLFEDYLKDLADPATRAESEQYLAEMEARGDLGLAPGEHLIRPKPAFALKAWTADGAKLFINVCHHPDVAPAQATRSTGPAGSAGASGEAWEVPTSLSPPRACQDAEGRPAVVVDAVFNSGTLANAARRPALKRLLVDVALERVDHMLATGPPPGGNNAANAAAAPKGLKRAVPPAAANSNSNSNSNNKFDSAAAQESVKRNMDAMRTLMTRAQAAAKAGKSSDAQHFATQAARMQQRIAVATAEIAAAAGNGNGGGDGAALATVFEHRVLTRENIGGDPPALVCRKAPGSDTTQSPSPAPTSAASAQSTAAAAATPAAAAKAAAVAKAAAAASPESKTSALAKDPVKDASARATAKPTSPTPESDSTAADEPSNGPAAAAQHASLVRVTPAHTVTHVSAPSADSTAGTGGADNPWLATAQAGLSARASELLATGPLATRPAALTVVFQLPQRDSARGIALVPERDRLTLESDPVLAAAADSATASASASASWVQYQANVKLPFPVLGEQAHAARWARKLRTLTVTLPVAPPGDEEIVRERERVEAMVRDAEAAAHRHQSTAGKSKHSSGSGSSSGSSSACASAQNAVVESKNDGALGSVSISVTAPAVKPTAGEAKDSTLGEVANKNNSNGSESPQTKSLSPDSACSTPLSPESARAVLMTSPRSILRRPSSPDLVAPGFASNAAAADAFSNGPGSSHGSQVGGDSPGTAARKRVSFGQFNEAVSHQGAIYHEVLLDAHDPAFNAEVSPPDMAPLPHLFRDPLEYLNTPSAIAAVAAAAAIRASRGASPGPNSPALHGNGRGGQSPSLSPAASPALSSLVAPSGPRKVVRVRATRRSPSFHYTQSPESVTLTFPVKGALLGKTEAEFGPSSVALVIATPAPRPATAFTLRLFAEVLPERCTLTVGKTNVIVHLSKAVRVMWPDAFADGVLDELNETANSKKKNAKKAAAAAADAAAADTADSADSVDADDAANGEGDADADPEHYDSNSSADLLSGSDSSSGADSMDKLDLGAAAAHTNTNSNGNLHSGGRATSAAAVNAPSLVAAAKAKATAAVLAADDALDSSSAISDVIDVCIGGNSDSARAKSAHPHTGAAVVLPSRGALLGSTDGANGENAEDGELQTLVLPGAAKTTVAVANASANATAKPGVTVIGDAEAESAAAAANAAAGSKGFAAAATAAFTGAARLVTQNALPYARAAAAAAAAAVMGSPQRTDAKPQTDADADADAKAEAEAEDAVLAALGVTGAAGDEAGALALALQFD